MGVVEREENVVEIDEFYAWILPWITVPSQGWLQQVLL